ncbi:MAG TPA: AzlC family ABC transporter permease [Candidatus Ruania gallistercoris]|uniref:AzlC family ABC transporter permease n=1 Tax=Candidatus Ruania gallistercoris TaxID=2838746 RepID=A0A9D2J5R3_9MICO|nr:AzlC family ABC transporter permease [Candidatus Ruania gallistercoris]
MGSGQRTAAVSIRTVVMIALAMALVGIAYGAMSVGAGLPLWVAPLLGVIVLAGSSEMLYVGLATATSPWLALPAALLVNVRHVPYGMALRPALGRGATRAYRAHVMNDEAVAFALAERDPERSGSALSRIGTGVLIGWPAGALAGGLLGRGIDQHTFGLDAIFPAVILALVLPALKRARLRPAVVGAAVVAVPAALLLPEGLAPLAGVLALPLAVWRSRELVGGADAPDGAESSDPEKEDGR